MPCDCIFANVFTVFVTFTFVIHVSITFYMIMIVKIAILLHFCVETYFDSAGHFKGLAYTGTAGI